MTLEGEPAPAVSSPAAIQGAAVVVPKLDADVSPSETGDCSPPTLHGNFHSVSWESPHWASIAVQPVIAVQAR